MHHPSHSHLFFPSLLPLLLHYPPHPPTTPSSPSHPPTQSSCLPCSPAILFITAFVTIFATAIAITKDLPDVEGDRK